MPEAIDTEPRRIGIASPVSMAQEVEPLARCGATEFYCGISMSSWARRYGGLAWLNRRGVGTANPNLDGVARLIAEANRFSLPVSVALNAPYYTASQLPEVVELAGELQKIGASGLIIADPSLMLALEDAGSTLPISVSSVAAVRNAGACEFYRELGAKRIILPRHLGVRDIAKIKRSVPEMEFEVFVLNDGCVYEEGHCATTHAAGAFCMTEWQYGFSRLDGEALSARERADLERNVADYREWVWYLSNCGRAFSERRLPNGPCGLCDIWDFAEMGIDCLKIVGREAHPERKLVSLRLVKTVVEKVAAGATRQECSEFSRELRGTPKLCSAEYMCYYRGRIDAD